MATLEGGNKFIEAINAAVAAADVDKVVEIGFLPDKTYPDGTLVAMVAAFQEFGTKSIPPRPFFRNMIASKSTEWPPMVAAIMKNNNFDAEKSLGQIGAVIASQLKQSIIDTNEPALSPITLMLRKMKADDPGLEITGKVVAEAARRVAAGMSTAGVSTKPLIETAVMLNSVDWVVKTK